MGNRWAYPEPDRRKKGSLVSAQVEWAPAGYAGVRAEDNNEGHHDRHI